VTALTWVGVALLCWCAVAAGLIPLASRVLRRITSLPHLENVVRMPEVRVEARRRQHPPAA